MELYGNVITREANLLLKKECQSVRLVRYPQLQQFDFPPCKYCGSKFALPS